jgi:hypothetical protein
MTTSVKKHREFLRLLMTTHKVQRMHMLQTISNDQFNILVEIVYNILHGICPLNKDEEVKIKKYKTLLRKLIEKNLPKRVKKNILLQIQQIVPTLLSSVQRYFSHNGCRGCISSERKIPEIVRKS